MDSIQIIINSPLDTLLDTASILADSVTNPITKSGTGQGISWTEIFGYIENVGFIIIGAFISKIFSNIRNHRRLHKLFEFLNVVFVSLLNRVNKHKTDYTELIKKLDDPTNTQLIPPFSPGSETDIVNSFKKEDLFEIYLIRLNSKKLENSKKDFLYLLNSIKYFDTVFSSIQLESKSTVESISKSFEKIAQLHLQLLKAVTFLQTQSTNLDEFVKEISVEWKSYLKQNEETKISNYDTYEKLLIDKLNAISVDYTNKYKDPRAYNLTMLLWTIKQELENFNNKKDSLKEFLKINEQYLQDESIKFRDTIEKFGNLKYRNWITLGFGKKLKLDKAVFDEIKRVE